MLIKGQSVTVAHHAHADNTTPVNYNFTNAKKKNRKIVSAKQNQKNSSKTSETIDKKEK